MNLINKSDSTATTQSQSTDQSKTDNRQDNVDSFCSDLSYALVSVKQIAQSQNCTVCHANSAIVGPNRLWVDDTVFDKSIQDVSVWQKNMFEIQANMAIRGQLNEKQKGVFKHYFDLKVQDQGQCDN
jgi:ABC-type antimicrobial peptide transport system ATPase subunit